MKIKSLEIKVIEQCNFRCKGCYTFSNIATPEEYGLWEYEADLLRVKTLFSMVNNIRILGGEPLLSANILEYIRLARKIFDQSNITIVTNGFLLSDMDESFFTALEEHDIALSISYYIGETRQKVKLGIQRLQEKGIKFYVYPTRYFCIEHNENSSDNPEMIYNACKLRIKPVTLYKGRIYACPKPFSIKHYDARYGTSFQNLHDGIDIYHSEITAADIGEHLEKPMDTCRLCSLKPGYSVWSQGKPEKNQWLNSSENEEIIPDFEWYEYLKKGNHLKYNVAEIISGESVTVYNHFLTEKEIENINGDKYIWLGNARAVYLYEELVKKTLANTQIKIKGILDSGEFNYQLFDRQNLVTADELSGQYVVIMLVSDYNNLYSEIKKLKKMIDKGRR